MPFALVCVCGLVVGMLVMLIFQPTPSTVIAPTETDSPLPSLHRRVDEHQRAITDLQRRKP